jgi:prevent-host-death family protein
MVKKVNAIKARHNLGQLLEEVYYRGDQYVIERAGRAMAAVVPLWQLEEWQTRRERFFEAIEGVWRKNRATSARTLQHDVDAAIENVRGRTAKKRP